MNPESSADTTSKGWIRNQVSYFSAVELSKKKSANILKGALGHWIDFFLIALIFCATFFAVSFVLIGTEVIIGELAGDDTFVTIVSHPLENNLVPSFSEWSKAPDEPLEHLRVVGVLSILIGLITLVCFIIVLIQLFKQNVGLGILGIIIGLFTFIWGWVKAKEKDLTRVMTVWTTLWVAQIIIYVVILVVPRIIPIANFIIAVLVGLYALYFYITYLIAEDGQTRGMRIANIELFRKDGKELSSRGGIGGIGAGPAIILSLFYIIFLPIFGIVSYLQFEFAFLWSFIDGFKKLDLVFAGTDIVLNLLLSFGYWILSVAIILLGILIFGIIFHIVWLLAGVIADVLGKDEPEMGISL